MRPLFHAQIRRYAQSARRRETTLAFPSEEHPPVAGRAVTAAAHRGRLSEELRLNQPHVAPVVESLRQAADPSVAIAYARDKGISKSEMWDTRNQLFGAVNRRITSVITGHHDQIEKVALLTAIFNTEVKPNEIHLRAQTYEDIFQCLLTTPPAPSAQPVPGQQLRRLVHTDTLFEMYHAMKAGFTAPTAKILEYLMFSVSYGLRTMPHKDRPKMESRAHKLWLDADRYTLTASKYTYTYYFEVCELCGVMHLALSRYVDAKERLGIQPDAGMCSTLIRGLVRNDQVEEAVAFIAAMYAVPVDVSLLDAVLECFGRSTDPMAAFSVYRAQVGPSKVRPGPTTFYYLMQACERLNDFRETVFVLEEMVRLSVQGTPDTLNLILKGLLLLEKEAMAHKLYLRMRRRQYKVWRQLERKIPEHVRNKGSQTEEIFRVTQETKAKLTDKYKAHYEQLAGGKPGAEGTAIAPVAKNGAGVQFPLTPRDEEHLRDFVVLRRLGWVSVEYMCQFLADKGVRVFGGPGETRKHPGPKKVAALCKHNEAVRRRVFGLVKRYFFPIAKSAAVEPIEVEAEDSAEKPRRFAVLGVEQGKPRDKSGKVEGSLKAS